jgi:hypothetical protein
VAARASLSTSAPQSNLAQELRARMQLVAREASEVRLQFKKTMKLRRELARANPTVYLPDVPITGAAH